MGCCESTNTRTFIPDAQNFKHAIKFNTSNLNSTICHIPKPQIDNEIISYKDNTISALTYSIIQGNELAFSTLISMGAKMPKCDLFFATKNSFPINTIFKFNYSALLKEFLPSYQSQKVAESMRKPYSISKFPVQIATEAGMLGVISTAKDYYKGALPEEFDPSSLNSEGENCGLIACKFGLKQPLIYFYEDCGVDLHLVNHKGENAILLCLKNKIREKTHSYLECLRYLIETVKVDITYHYEEALNLAAFNKDTYKYIESKLASFEVYYDSKEFSDESVEFGTEPVDSQHEDDLVIFSPENSESEFDYDDKNFGLKCECSKNSLY